MTLGAFKRFQSDDYIMLGALCFYTTLIATINIVRHTSSNLLPPGYDVDNMTKEDISERTYGSKLILVVEQCQCVTVWAAKACLLIMYLRITNMRREHIVIWVLAAYVAFGFVFMEIFYVRMLMGKIWSCRGYSLTGLSLAVVRSMVSSISQLLGRTNAQHAV